MTDSQEHMNDWETCPPGTLKTLATKLSGRRRRAVAGRIGVAVACTLVLLATGKAVLQSGGSVDSSPTYGGIACRHVIEKLDAWAKNTLDEATANRIDAHLKLCPSCSARARNLQRKPPVVAIAWALDGHHNLAMDHR